MNLKARSRSRRHVLPGLILAFAAGGAAAEKLVMPPGMGGVPDIGAIPCKVFNEMTVVAPLGTRHSLLTWSAGYLSAASGKSLDQIASAAAAGGQAWDYARLAGHLAGYCTANPTALTREAAIDLGRQLGVQAPAATPGTASAPGRTG